MKTPRWLSEMIIYAMHKAIVQAQASCCVRIQKDNRLTAILARPRQRFAQGETDLFTLAACYGFQLATTKIFAANNASLAFMAMYTFLGLNGIQLTASQQAVVDTMTAIMNQKMTEKELVQWLHHHSEIIYES